MSNVLSRATLALTVAVLLTSCADEELPAAADGTDLASCADGQCEVQVSTGDRIDCPGLGSVEIAVTDDQIEVASRSDDGNGNTSELSASGVAGHDLQLNDAVFTVVAVVGEQGVLRLDASPPPRN